MFLLVPLLTVSSNKGSNGWRSATFNKNPPVCSRPRSAVWSVAGIRHYLRTRPLERLVQNLSNRERPEKL